jgi:hypothetical protein
MPVGTRWSSNLGFTLLVIAAVVVFGAQPAGAQTAITTCGQEVRGDAYLVGNLDCPVDTEAAVVIENGHLDLAGFTIRGGEYGVICGRDTGETINGDELYKYGKCSISDGTIADQTVVGVDARDIELTDVTIAPAPEAIFGIIVFRRMLFANVDLQLPSAVAAGIFGVLNKPRIEGSNLTITGGGHGISFVNKVKIAGMTASGYLYRAIGAKTVDLENADLTGGTDGIQAGSARIADSTITGHSDTGVRATRLRISGSTVTGNTLDLRLERRPKLENTICDTSNGWGVCAND